jgi:hypothetical protein
MARQVTLAVNGIFLPHRCVHIAFIKKTTVFRVIKRCSSVKFTDVLEERLASILIAGFLLNMEVTSATETIYLYGVATKQISTLQLSGEQAGIKRF